MTCIELPQHLHTKSFLYVIERPATGEYYLGRTRVGRRRFQEHRRELRKGVHSNRHLQFAYDKYGASSFRIRVVAYVPVDDIESAEQDMIHACIDDDRCYNISREATAGANLTGGARTIEERRLAIESRIGRPFTPDEEAIWNEVGHTYKSNGSTTVINQIQTEIRRRKPKEHRKGKPHRPTEEAIARETWSQFERDYLQQFSHFRNRHGSTFVLRNRNGLTYEGTSLKLAAADLSVDYEKLRIAIQPASSRVYVDGWYLYEKNGERIDKAMRNGKLVTPRPYKTSRAGCK